MWYNLTTRGLLLLYSLLILVPVAVVGFLSFTKSSHLLENPLGIPKQLDLSNYVALFAEQDMGRYMQNSLFVTVVSVAIVLLLGSMIAYGITRLSGWWGQALFALFALGMMIPNQVNMGQLYALLVSLELTNSFLGLILVYISVNLPIAVFIIAGFMRTIPTQLFEACAIDGASEWRMFRHMALPLSLPSLATVAIFLFVIIWNDLFYPLLLISNEQYQTLPLALLQFQGEYMTNYPVLFAGVLIASLPMILAYISLQRYFIAGMTAGSVKG